MISEFLKTFIGWSIILPGCYLAGAGLSRFVPEKDSRLQGVFFIALGLIVLMSYLIVIGSAGQLNQAAVLVFFGAVFVFQRSQFRAFGQWLSTMARYPWICENLFDRFLAVVFYSTVVLTFGFCLLPETANDALCYQLNVPKEFVWQGSIWPVQYDANSYMPMAMNLLYAVGLLFKSIGIAKLFHALTGLLLTYVIAFKVEHLTGDSRIARFSALLFWLAPVVVNEATTVYVDLGVSFFLLISFLWLRAAVHQEKKSLFFIAGIGAGVTIAVKFSLLLAMPVLVLVGLSAWLRPFQFKKIICFAPFFSAGFFAGCGYWFTRNWILTGNPTFPYFGELFHTPIILNEYATYLDLGYPKTLLNFILTPIWLTFDPIPFDHHFWAGPYMALSYFAFIKSCTISQARVYFFFVLLLGGAWFMTTQVTRYLLPVLPFWYIAAGAGTPLVMNYVKTGLLARVIKAGILGVIACLLLAGAYHYRTQFKVLAGIWSPAAYLKRAERSYPAAQWADQHLPKGARVLNAEEIRPFYFTRPMVREEFLHFFTRYAEGRNVNQIIGFLKEQGFTHIMRVKQPGHVEPLEGRLKWLSETTARPDLAELLGTVNSETSRGGKYVYSFYRIR